MKRFFRGRARPSGGVEVRSRSRRRPSLAPELLEGRLLMAVGGGYLGSGLTGAYYANPNLAGTPSFTRKDGRIDFNWGTKQAPGGAISDGFVALSTDNYSIHWTGQVVANYSESYKFRLTYNDGATLRVRPSGEANWTTLVNAWNAKGTKTTNTSFAMVAGVNYDVQLDYRELGGAAKVVLEWSRPSTPSEVIEPATQIGLNPPSIDSIFADLVKGGDNDWLGINGGPRPPVDADGWPRTDAGYIIQTSSGQGLGLDPLNRGRISFQFRGSARPLLFGNVEQDSLTYSYDSGKNLTEGSFVTVDLGRRFTSIEFMDTSRNGLVGGPGGITDLRLMRPSGPDSDVSYSFDSIFIREYVESLQNYTLIRYQRNQVHERNWADRTLPGYFNQDKGEKTAPKFGVGTLSDNGMSWEYEVMLANESGRDLYVSLPTAATGGSILDLESYVVKLAKLIKYGSDGVEPYSSPQSNPVYPPLNPNLRFYFEFGNELWNTGGAFRTNFDILNQLVIQDVLADNADFRAFNYDGLSTELNGNGEYVSMPIWRYRKLAQRTLQASEIFRGVLGDDAMMSRVRPMLNWQIQNINGTGSKGLDFLDKYYNNGDGQSHVLTPHPVNYFIYGGGGISYYRASNLEGLTNVLPDSGFDATTFADGYTQNAVGTPWTFTGTAGIARDGGPDDDIPPAFDGGQMAYITGFGRIRFDFTIPSGGTSDVYAFALKAVNRRAGSDPDQEKFQVFLDGELISAVSASQSNGYTPPAYDSVTQWKAQLIPNGRSEYYATKLFHSEPGTSHHVEIRGYGRNGDPSDLSDTVFIEDLHLTSADAIFASETIPSSVTTIDYEAVIRIEAEWAQAYGIVPVSYEGGWAISRKDGGSPLQNYVKYSDSRTVDVEKSALAIFQETSPGIQILGVYNQWPEWSDHTATQGLLDPRAYPLVQAATETLSLPRTTPVLGVTLPATLTASATARTIGGNIGTSELEGNGGWMSWTVLAPSAGTYRLIVSDTSPGGRLTLLADERTVAVADTGGEISGIIDLTAGQHTLKLRNVSASTVHFGSIAVDDEQALDPPVLLLANPVAGQALLGWTVVHGATGYAVLWGTSPGNYPNRLDFPALTTATIGGLVSGQTYYFAVGTLKHGRLGRPSNELVVVA